MGYISVPHGLSVYCSLIPCSGPVGGGLLDMKEPIGSSEVKPHIQVSTNRNRRWWGHSVEV